MYSSIIIIHKIVTIFIAFYDVRILGFTFYFLFLLSRIHQSKKRFCQSIKSTHHAPQVGPHGSRDKNVTKIVKLSLKLLKLVRMRSSIFFLGVPYHMSAVKKTRGQSSSPTRRSIHSKMLTEVRFSIFRVFI